MVGLGTCTLTVHPPACFHVPSEALSAQLGSPGCVAQTNLADPLLVEGVFFGGTDLAYNCNKAPECLDHLCCRTGYSLITVAPPTGILNSSVALEPVSGLGHMVCSCFPSPIQQPISDGL
ncbi:hypothetical protein Nepgr_006707 [Nepenthes gracilis]|uniref:Uncharacterized protein n=1 Tax=Nepenthes gracilis TaxID=150966 RepID=A0AAD3S5I5_NEPGR|nr:hypothetical protein Nepgr_006707 [Nepenthes gracilis]